MIPELGQFALLLALSVALVQATLPLVGAARGRADWMAFARPAAQAHCLVLVARRTVPSSCARARLVRRARN